VQFDDVAHVLRLLNGDEVVHHGEQATRLSVVLTDHGLTNLAKSETPQALPLVPARTDGATHLGDLDLTGF
jgi:hypothetical protein